MRQRGPKVVIARFESQLAALGLTTIGGVKRFEGALVKRHGAGRRDILKIGFALPEGGVRTLYLKRNWKPYKKDGLAGLLRRGVVWSQSRREWENSLALQHAGLATAELVAYGEDCGPLWERFSFIITAAATGDRTLEDFLPAGTDRELRRAMIEALARDVHRMHEAGLAAPDLFTRHIFVDTSTAAPRFCLIDMARLDRRASVSATLRARDLAALNITAPLRFVTARERLRFLRAYAGTVDRELVRLIGARMAHLLARKKFQDFRKHNESNVT